MLIASFFVQKTIDYWKSQIKNESFIVDCSDKLEYSYTTTVVGLLFVKTTCH